MGIIYKATERERLARMEVTLGALVREVSELRASERVRFFWIVGILIGVFLPILAGAQVALIVLILRWQGIAGSRRNDGNDGGITRSSPHGAGLGRGPSGGLRCALTSAHIHTSIAAALDYANKTGVGLNIHRRKKRDGRRQGNYF